MSIIPFRAPGPAAAVRPLGPVDQGTGRGGPGLGTMAGLGVLAGLSSALVALIGQARLATRSIEAAAVEAALADGTLVPLPVPGGTRAQQRLADHLVHVRLPQGEGIYAPDGTRIATLHDAVRDDAEQPLTLAMLGDSTSVGYGTLTADDLPGVILARGIAAQLGRRVRMRSHGLTGARTTDLTRQLELCLADPPDVVVVLIGANDMRDMVPPSRSAALLGEATAALRARGIPVVAGTCPDFGVIAAIPQPLRSFLGTFSLRLAALQQRAVTEAGGSAVALAQLVSPQFRGNPDMFARDRFHPSGAGYGRAMAVLLPAAIEELEKAAGTAAGSPKDTAQAVPDHLHPLSA